jgi:hypothetical protein
MLEKFTRWVIFGVLAALVPLAAKYLALEVNKAPVSPNEVFKRGSFSC